MSRSKVTVYDCSDKMEIIAAEQSWPGSWGRAKSPREAIKIAKANGASGKSGFLLYAVPVGTVMNGMGQFEWKTESSDKAPFEGIIKLGTA